MDTRTGLSAGIENVYPYGVTPTMSPGNSVILQDLQRRTNLILRSHDPFVHLCTDLLRNLRYKTFMHRSQFWCLDEARYGDQDDSQDNEGRFAHLFFLAW